MITTEAIRQVISTGITIQFPYKSKISSWYGEIKVYKYDGFYHVDGSIGRFKFHDPNEAADFFISKAFSSENVGYIQSRLMDKKYINIYDDSSLENPSKDLKDLFKKESKLVDEEFKLFNIKLRKFPTAQEAVSKFSELVPHLTPENIKEKLFEFDKDYSTLNPYINLSFKYDVEGSDYGYRQSFDYENFTIEDMIEAKTRKDLPQHKMTWNCLQISFRVDGDQEFYFYDLKF